MVVAANVPARTWNTAGTPNTLAFAKTGDVDLIVYDPAEIAGFVHVADGGTVSNVVFADLPLAVRTYLVLLSGRQTAAVDMLNPKTKDAD